MGKRNGQVWNGLAVDLGASSGLVLLAQYDGERLQFEEIHSFKNEPVRLHSTLHWDILRLFHEIKGGLRRAEKRVKKDGGSVASLGIDSWAVDYGLLDRSGRLLGNPVHYRNEAHAGAMEKLLKRIPRDTIFRETGIQFMPINTIYQLSAMKDEDHPHLEQAETFLMIPDLIHYFLTGEKAAELTNATTTQLFDPTRRTWSEPLIGQLGLPRPIFPPIVEPGTEIGKVLPSVSEEIGDIKANVIAVATHDTGSAVAAVPAQTERFAYLSSGTWSLLGTEVKEPVLSDRALALNFTNEGGVNGTYRLLKNIMGLWLLQEVKRVWEAEGDAYTWDELTHLTSSAPPFVSLVDPDAPEFLTPGDMPERIRAYCRKTGQPVPETRGAVLRCITESLALKHRFVLDLLEELTGQPLDVLHMVGGGTRNELLCQWTANACGRPVVTGPVEASSLGNILVQLMAAGEVNSLSEGRQLISQSVPLKTYEPKDRDLWSEAYERFNRLCRLPQQQS
jgi:rhamnulokinase